MKLWECDRCGEQTLVPSKRTSGRFATEKWTAYIEIEVDGDFEFCVSCLIFLSRDAAESLATGQETVEPKYKYYESGGTDNKSG